MSYPLFSITIVTSGDKLNSFDPDQAKQKIGPDLDTNCLTLYLTVSCGSYDFRFWKFSHYKSMGALCCHGNQSSNPLYLMMLYMKFVN